MKRRIPVVVAIVLVAAAFAAGYATRWVDLPSGRKAGEQVLAQPQPSPSPQEPPRQKEQQAARDDKGTVAGTVENVRGRTLVIRVSRARGVRAEAGSSLSVQVGADATILRSVTLADLTKGSQVALQGTLEDNTFVVRQIIVGVAK